MMRIFITTLSLVGALLLLGSCVQESLLYHQQQVLPAEGWLKRDTLVFNLDGLQPAHTYHFIIEGRLNATYPFTELIVDLSNASKGKRQKVVLHPKKSSLSISHGIFYQSVQSDTLQFSPDSTRFSIHLFHHMRRDRLEGVNDMGIQVFH